MARDNLEQWKELARRRQEAKEGMVPTIEGTRQRARETLESKKGIVYFQEKLRDPKERKLQTAMRKLTLAVALLRDAQNSRQYEDGRTLFDCLGGDQEDLKQTVSEIAGAITPDNDQLKNPATIAKIAETSDQLGSIIFYAILECDHGSDSQTIDDKCAGMTREVAKHENLMNFPREQAITSILFMLSEVSPGIITHAELKALALSSGIDLNEPLLAGVRFALGGTVPAPRATISNAPGADPVWARKSAAPAVSSTAIDFARVSNERIPEETMRFLNKVYGAFRGAEKGSERAGRVALKIDKLVQGLGVAFYQGNETDVLEVIRNVCGTKDEEALAEKAIEIAALLEPLFPRAKSPSPPRPAGTRPKTPPATPVPPPPPSVTAPIPSQAPTPQAAPTETKNQDIWHAGLLIPSTLNITGEPIPMPYAPPPQAASAETEDQDIYREAVQIVVDTQNVSVSGLQHRLRIGYQKAASLVDRMEQAGIVGPATAGKPRQVLLKPMPFASSVTPPPPPKAVPKPDSALPSPPIEIEREQTFGESPLVQPTPAPRLLELFNKLSEADDYITREEERHSQEAPRDIDHFEDLCIHVAEQAEHEPDHAFAIFQHEVERFLKGEVKAYKSYNRQQRVRKETIDKFLKNGSIKQALETLAQRINVPIGPLEEAIILRVTSSDAPILRSPPVTTPLPSQAPAPQAAPAETADQDIYRKAVQIVTDTRQVSVSGLQHRLRIGYQRAARLVDQMEQAGIVGPATGGKPRQVFLQPMPFASSVTQPPPPKAAAVPKPVLAPPPSPIPIQQGPTFGESAGPAAPDDLSAIFLDVPLPERLSEIEDEDHFVDLCNWVAEQVEKEPDRALVIFQRNVKAFLKGQEGTVYASPGRLHRLDTVGIRKFLDQPAIRENLRILAQKINHSIGLLQSEIVLTFTLLH